MSIPSTSPSALTRSNPYRSPSRSRASTQYSSVPPDEDFVTVVEQAFASCEAHVISFPNPLTGGTSASTVYVAS